MDDFETYATIKLIDLVNNIKQSLDFSKLIDNSFLNKKPTPYFDLEKQINQFLTFFEIKDDGELNQRDYKHLAFNQLYRMKQVNFVRSQIIFGEIYIILKDLQLDKLPLGFDETSLPDKQWLINIIATLNPTHPCFKVSNMIEGEAISIKDFKILKTYDFSLLKSRRCVFFKLTKEQQIQYQLRKQNLFYFSFFIF